MASIKLKHASGNSTILNSPAANPSADVTLKLPSTTGSAGQVLQVASANHSATNAELEFAAAAGGISDFDTWYVTSSVQGNQTPIENNWSRWTSYSGTGSVTFSAPSSGIWTFPSTGYWLIDFEAHTYTSSAAQRGVNSYLYVTTNNSSYAQAAQQSTNHYDSGNDTYGHTRLGYILDVTDTSNVKIKLYIGYQTSTTYLRGHGAYLFTNVKFFKLKDT